MHIEGNVTIIYVSAIFRKVTKKRNFAVSMMLECNLKLFSE